MAQTIKIKRSTSTATPTSLEAGELAYSFKSNSKKLFIGDASNNVIAIGGETVFGLAEGALQTTGGTMTGNIVMSGTTTVDGRDLSVDGSKLDGIETGADVTDATNVNAAGAVMNSDTSTASMSFVIDEDTMSSDLATKVPTQQSVKAYVDTEIGNLSTGVTSVSGTAPIVSSGGASPAISISLDNVTVEKNTSNNKLQAKTGTVVDNGTALATGDQIHAFVTGQGYVTSSGVTSISSSTTNQITVTDGSTATPEIAAVTGTVANGGTALATGDQIHDFVTGLLGDFTFSGGEISSTQSTITIDPSVNGPSGVVVIDGSLEVKGTTTTVNSTTVTLADNIIRLNKDYSSAPSGTATYGIELNRGTPTDGTQTLVSFLYNETGDKWTVETKNGTNNEIIHTGNSASATYTLDGGSF